MNASLSQRAGKAMSGIDFSDYGDHLAQYRRFVAALERADTFEDLPANVQAMIRDGERKLAAPPR